MEQDSAIACEVARLTALLADMPEIRRSRVAQLFRAIDLGLYSVTNRQIAESMLDDFRGNGTGKR
jgi:anti-sigma28 factor (negative regulator of flagellin synthesis)